MFYHAEGFKWQHFRVVTWPLSNGSYVSMSFYPVLLVRMAITHFTSSTATNVLKFVQKCLIYIACITSVVLYAGLFRCNGLKTRKYVAK